jgi:hypothetical protein
MAMLIYFLIPVFALLLAIHACSDQEGWITTPAWRAGQFWLSVVYSATNLIHWIADIRIPDSRSDQVILMAVLTAIGGLLNLETWRWWHL